MSQRSGPRSERLSGPPAGSPTPPAREPLVHERAAAEWIETSTESEDDYVLRELERVREELAPRLGPSRPRRSSEDDRHWGATSPYLEERLNVARAMAAQLAAEASDDQLVAPGVKSALETIDHELGRASAELGFARAEAWREESSDGVSWRVPGSLSPLSPHPILDRRASGNALPVSMSAAPVGPPTGSFEDFTVARYNRTVAALHARRRLLAWGTVVAAAAISAALLYLTLRAHEAVPAMWLAVLPLVWMIPVPFFVAGFRGTHRILQQGRLDLPEE